MELVVHTGRDEADPGGNLPGDVYQLSRTACLPRSPQTTFGECLWEPTRALLVVAIIPLFPFAPYRHCFLAPKAKKVDDSGGLWSFWGQSLRIFLFERRSARQLTSSMSDATKIIEKESSKRFNTC